MIASAVRGDAFQSIFGILQLTADSSTSISVKCGVKTMRRSVPTAHTKNSSCLSVQHRTTAKRALTFGESHWSVQFLTIADLERTGPLSTAPDVINQSQAASITMSSWLDSKLLQVKPWAVFKDLGLYLVWVASIATSRIFIRWSSTQAGHNVRPELLEILRLWSLPLAHRCLRANDCTWN